MLPQLTVYAKILYLLMVVISGALCSDHVIMSKCAHNKNIYIDYDGKASLQDIPQIITIVGTDDFVKTNVFKITLFAKETQMYLCFNNHWRLVGMKKLNDRCYFQESIVRGYVEYHSVQNLVRRVGFTHRGKPVGPKKNVTDDCYRFTSVAASEFTRTQNATDRSAAAAGSNNGHSNKNSISSTSNSRTRNSSSSSSNLNNSKKSNTVIPHRTRHRHNSTRIGAKRLHHLQEHQESDTRLRLHPATSIPSAEFSGTRRRRKKKKIAQSAQHIRPQYLNPKDPEHRRMVYEQHEHQQQRHHERHQHQQTPQYESGGESDIYPNIQDEYSNDDASAILPDLPNNLDSSTEYLYSSSSSVSNTKHRANYNKKYLGHGSPNHKRVTSSSLSSPSNSASRRAISSVDVVSRSSSYHSTLDSDTTRKYYKKSNPALVAASYQSTVVGDALNSPHHRDSTLGDSKIATTNLGKMKTNQKDKNIMRLRKKIQTGS